MFVHRKNCLRSTLSLLYRMASTKAPISYQILDIKNSHLIYVKDPQSSLPYMSEIVTDRGHRGVVIKLQERGTTVIGMYENVQNYGKVTVVDEAHNGLGADFVPKFNHIYDMNYEWIAEVKNVDTNSKMRNQLGKEGKRLRIQPLSPLLSLNNDIFVGDFVTFAGPLGSGRTRSALQCVQSFTNSNIADPVGIYMNPNPKQFKSKCMAAAQKYRTFSLGRLSAQLSQLRQKVDKSATASNISSVGVYMMAVKCIKMANKLKKEGKNVMLVVDNINEILSNEWTVLQTLKLVISPFSILNELYSCSSKGQLGRATKANDNQGSLTTIAITSPEGQDVVQEYTTFGNNTKYLRTLCPQIQYPLQLRVNHNPIRSLQLLDSMRRKINILMHEKKDKQMLTKLKFLKDQPWEHYFILDSEWWVQGLKTYKPKSIGDRDLFFWFINTNIEEDHVAHWKIGCVDAYQRFLNFLARPEDPRVGMDMLQLEQFIDLAKADSVYDVFKKDYLH